MNHKCKHPTHYLDGVHWRCRDCGEVVGTTNGDMKDLAKKPKRKRKGKK